MQKRESTHSNSNLALGTNNSRTGGVVGRFPALLHQVRPVITVNKN